eukprot:UN01900
MSMFWGFSLISMLKRTMEPDQSILNYDAISVWSKNKDKKSAFLGGAHSIEIRKVFRN